MPYGIGADDLLGIPTGGLYNVGKAIAGGYSSDPNQESGAGELVKDYFNNGKNKFQETPYTEDQTYWGGSPEAGQQYSNFGMGMAGQSSYNTGQWSEQANTGSGAAQATEDATLAGREADTRNGDQSGALQLAREAALGQAPSQAAYQMQAGLDAAMAGQQSMMGSARGAAAIANAQGNAAANSANLQNQAFNSAAQLRAQEMAQARSQYGGLAGQMREQDLARLGQGDAMAMNNAGQMNNYKIGFANAANGAMNAGQGWYTQAGHPNDVNSQLQNDANQRKFQAWNAGEDRAAGVSQANAEHTMNNRNQVTNTILGFVQGGGQAAASGGRPSGGGGMGNT
jgi:hypothetical protein